jgi:hypothetical protein
MRAWKLSGGVKATWETSGEGQKQVSAGIEFNSYREPWNPPNGQTVRSVNLFTYLSPYNFEACKAFRRTIGHNRTLLTSTGILLLRIYL